MSSKAPRKNPVTAATSPDDYWRPRRYRWSWRLVRRGRDKKWHFPGQQDDEIVRMVVRKHKWFLVQPALPLIGALVVFFLVLAGAAALPTAGPLWPFLEIVVGALCLIALGYFIWRDFITWWYDVSILTNKRIINWHGFLQPSRKETPIEKVQQVSIHRDTPLQASLNYGDLYLYLAGGRIVLKDVPDPRKVKDAFQGVTNEFQAKKPPKEKPATVVDPQMNALLEDLAISKEVPKPPDADAKYPPLHPDKVLGPRRTFGGILRIRANVHYSWGESTVMYLQHSRYVLLQRIALPLLALLVVLPVGILGPTSGFVNSSIVSLWWLLMTIAVLGLLILIVLIYINFVDDVYILTNKRIIDIERKLFFLYEERDETEYKNIKDIQVKIANVLENLFDIGDVYIETPGSSPDIVFKKVAHPFFIQDKIYELKGLKEKADEIKKENDQKEELHRWFSKVIGKLEQVPQLNGAPNLQRLELLEAMERANELGFHVIVVDEDPSNPDIPPGLVVHQNPPPGTVINPGGEIQVILSRKATAAELAEMDMM